MSARQLRIQFGSMTHSRYPWMVVLALMIHCSDACGTSTRTGVSSSLGFDTIELICEAGSGTLTANASSVCHTGEPVNISAVWNDPIVPSGFQGLFLLTTGPTSIIVQGSFTPAFNVTDLGVYTMHSLVYDPQTLNLAVLMFGQSTLADLHAMLLQGGGMACGAMDMSGAAFVVQDCSILCDARPGTLITATSVICSMTGEATIHATHNQDSVVPEGYGSVFLLSSGNGGVILAMSTSPQFDVAATGLYRFHTLVHDPATVDLASIVPGNTTIGSLNAQLVQGGGALCAGLDVAGASTSVQDCRPLNDDCGAAMHISISGPDDCNAHLVQGDNSYATQEEDNVPACPVAGASIADVWYTFNSGGNAEVSMVLGPISMSNWGLSVSPICGGTELVCELGPAGPIDMATVPYTEYRVRIFSIAEQGSGGAFAFCITAAQPSVICDGGEIGSSEGSLGISVCKDGQADPVEFSHTSSSISNYAYVLTDPSDLVLALVPEGPVDLDTLALGSYRAWGLAYVGELEGLVAGVPLAALTGSGGCAQPSSSFVALEIAVCTGVGQEATGNWSVAADHGRGVLSVRYFGPATMVQVQVLASDGRQLSEQRIPMEPGQMHTIDTSEELREGLYVLRLTTSDHQHAWRFFWGR